jgi:hypothetical protein
MSRPVPRAQEGPIQPPRDPLLKTALQGAMGVLLLGALGATFYQLYHDNGLFRLASELQAFVLFGTYFPFVSFLVAFFVCALPAVGVGLLKDALYGPNEPPFPPGNLPSEPPPPKVAPMPPKPTGTAGPP